MNTQQDDQVPEMNGAPVQPVSVGKSLREARERLGLSVGDVANRIKFAPRQIEWLEEDDFVRLPEAAFVRGFVRSYARLVELDPSHLLAGLPSSHAQPASSREVKSVEIPMPTAFSARRHNIVWLAAALVVALSLAIFERLHERSPAQGKPVASMTVEPIELPGGVVEGASAPVALSTMAAQAEVEAPEATKPEIQKPEVQKPVTHPAPRSVVQSQPVQSSQAITKPAAPAKAAPAKVAPPVAVVQPSQPVPQLVAVAAPVPVEQSAVNAETHVTDHALRIELDEEAWVEVRDASDKPLLAKMCVAGSLVRVAGKAPLQVIIGNAKAARLFDNGKKINLVRYTTAEVAKVKLK
jgi:cytoskeleton protein RodZ